MTEYNDPVCGMVVLPESAQAKAEFEGKTFYFCSHECMAEFKANPKKYAR